MTIRHSFFFVLAFTILACSTPAPVETSTDAPGWHDEIVYHVVQRSFYDSNGDLHGDLNGFTQKLGYLKELGVTTILFLPLYESDFYHNYFPTEYEKIDPEFGTMDDYIQFVKAVHDHGLKFIMDMETQYAQEGHPWFDAVLQDPESPFAAYISSEKSSRRNVDELGFRSLLGYDGFRGRLATLNLNHPPVREYLTDFYAFWVDPNGDGVFDDGVDGYRIDHIMDDLDYEGVFTNMYADFWKPLIDTCRSINPDLFIIGEQANWLEYGEDMLMRTGADASFGFPIRFAISGAPTIYMGGRIDPAERDELNVRKIEVAVEETQRRIPDGRYYLNFIENHDMERWASAMEGHEGKIRSAAVLYLLLPGIPSLYYGQELGLTGLVGEWGGDGNHVPVREAFPWTPNADDPGIAVFYKDTGPWWDQSYFNTGETQELALSVQRDDPNSTWNFYRRLIALRKNDPVFMYGDYRSLPQADTTLMAFAREYKEDRAVVLLNFSEDQKAIDLSALDVGGYDSIFGEEHEGGDSIVLDGYRFVVLGNS